MSTQFKPFHFESSFASAKVESHQALNDLIARLMEQLGSRDLAIAYLATARKAPVLVAFGHVPEIYTGEFLDKWLADQGITLE